MTRRAFSLLETLFSFFLVMFVMLVLLHLFPGTLAATRNSECELHAQSIAEESLESLRAAGLGQLANGRRTVTLDGVTYKAVTETFDVPGLDPMRVRGIRVRVTWTFRIRRQILREVILNNVRA